MQDKFHALSLKQALAVQIFYSSPEDENLIGKTLNGKELFEPVGVIRTISFRPTEAKKDEVLEKLIAAKAYNEILQKYDKPQATFKMEVIYKDEKGVLHEANLTNAIKLAFSPEELPEQIMAFLLKKEEYSFLK